MVKVEEVICNKQFCTIYYGRKYENTSYPVKDRGRDSSVGIASCYGLDGPGIESRRGARFSALAQTGLWAHSA
jgi:hypothetical protein